MAELDRIKPNTWDRTSPVVAPGVASPYDVVDWPSSAPFGNETQSLHAQGYPQTLREAVHQPYLWLDEGYYHDGLPIAGTELPPTTEGLS